MDNHSLDDKSNHYNSVRRDSGILRHLTVNFPLLLHTVHQAECMGTIRLD